MSSSHARRTPAASVSVRRFSALVLTGDEGCQYGEGAREQCDTDHGAAQPDSCSENTYVDRTDNEPQV
jgi:hypothetical protein